MEFHSCHCFVNFYKIQLKTVKIKLNSSWHKMYKKCQNIGYA
jgi:hypothetical protein